MNRYGRSELMKLIGMQKIPADGIPCLKEIVRANLEDFLNDGTKTPMELYTSIAVDAYLYGHMDGIRHERERIQEKTKSA